MSAEIDRNLASQAEDVRRHVRKVMLDLVQHERRKASKGQNSTPSTPHAEHPKNAGDVAQGRSRRDSVAAPALMVPTADADGFITSTADQAVTLSDRHAGPGRIR